MTDASFLTNAPTGPELLKGLAEISRAIYFASGAATLVGRSTQVGSKYIADRLTRADLKKQMIDEKAGITNGKEQEKIAERLDTLIEEVRKLNEK